MVPVTHLRLAAALAHGIADADLHVVTGDTDWIVSYRHPRASVSPCAFRHLVLAALRGAPVAIFPADSVQFVGALREIGAGIYERHGSEGGERHVATLLSLGHLHTVLASIDDAHERLSATIRADEELGVSVVRLTAAHPASELELDVVAHAVAAACFVEELIGADRAEAS